MSADDFRYLQMLVKRVSGNVLEDGKEYLATSRLGPVAQRHGCDSVTALLRLARRSEEIVTEVVESMTTKETMFFRDPHLFEALRNRVLPGLVGRGPLHIWCLGCSTGQEPYSLAMLLDDHFPTISATVRAGDISHEALEVAAAGRYNEFEVARGLPPGLLERHFRPESGRWQIGDAIRRRVSYERLNLVEPFPDFPPADLIFIRNVLIYFDETLKGTVVERLRGAIKPDGHLFLGAPENLMAWPHLFTPVPLGRTLAYRPV